MDNELKERLNELVAASRKADAEDCALVESLEIVVRHTHYQALLELYNKRIQGLSEELMAPAGSVDGMVALEFVKGAMFGLILARDLPHIIVESFRATATKENDDE